jgi:hypothetical protein
MMTTSISIVSLRVALIILALPILSACSAIKLAYNQAPELLYWWLDSYIDFNSQQTPKVRDELARLQAWHRSSELPKTSALLQKAAALLPGNVAPAQVCAVFDEVRVLGNNVTDQALPAVAELVPTITAPQLEKLQRKYQKNNDEFAKDYLQASPEERKTKRMKSAVERSERIYGKLGDAQLQAISTAIDNSSFDATLSLKERERRQKDAIDTLRQLSLAKPSPAATQTALRAYLERSIISPDPAYRQHADKLVQESCESFAAVHASTTPAQRAKAVQTLQGYETDLRTLAGVPR